MTNASWPLVMLDELVQITSGNTPSKETPSYWGDTLPWVSAKDLKSLYIKDSLQKLSDSGAQRAKKAPANTVLILVRGMALRNNVPVGVTTREIAFNQDIKALHPGERINAEYLAYYLRAQNNLLHQLVDSSGHGTGRLDTDLLRNTLVVVPPMAMQLKMVETFRHWSKAIDLYGPLIEKKEAMYTLLCHIHLFGTHASSDAPRRACHWFNVPEHWQIIEIGDVANEVKRINTQDADLPVLSCTKHEGLMDSRDYFDSPVHSKNTARYKMVNRGEFVYASNHIEEGSIGHQNTCDTGLVSPMYTVFECNDKVDPGFLIKVLKTALFQQIFNIYTNGSVNRRGNLGWKTFERLPLPLPPLKTQQQINTLLDHTLEEISLLKRQRQHYEMQKTAVMQNMIASQWQYQDAVDSHVSHAAPQ